MGATSWLPSTYWNCCIVALASLMTNTLICNLTFPYLLLRSQSAQLSCLAEHLPLQSTTYLKFWKPMVTLMAEVNDLINQGMADDYNCKPEHSTTGEGASTGADVFSPLKAEVSAPPLDTSSQASIEEMETSQESNPINVYSPMVAGSNCSDSPTIDLRELQVDANLATNHMLSIKRSSDLKRQQASWDFEASLHQQETEEAAASERAKFVHSRKDLNSKVKCTKAVMKAKYDYRMAVQEARMIRCSKLQESEAAYLEALGENTATKSIQCATLHREHVKHMH